MIEEMFESSRSNIAISVFSKPEECWTTRQLEPKLLDLKEKRFSKC